MSSIVEKTRGTPTTLQREKARLLCSTSALGIRTSEKVQ